MSFDALTLQCFLAIVETGSFTHAAHKVSRTQSAVSQQIIKLEAQIGKPVFTRGKILSLTTAGKSLLGYARKIIQLNYDAIDSFKQPSLQGEVFFGLPEDFAGTLLSEFLIEFTSLHPRILLNVECGLTLTLFERFKKKEFDLILVKMNKPEDCPHSMEVWSETLEWVRGKNTPIFENNNPIPLVLSPPPCVYRSRAIHALEKNNLKWRIVFSSHSYAGKIAAVRAGMGLTILPRNMIPIDFEIVRNTQSMPLLDHTHISLLKHHENNLAVNSFEKFVLERLRP